MSENEQKIAETKGRCTTVVRDGQQFTDAEWVGGRFLLSNRRLVIATSDGKRTIPLDSISDVGGRYDVNQAVGEVSNYLSIRFDGNDVILVVPREPDFETDLFGALLDGEFVLARHPAVEGGVVQETEWEKARLKLDEAVVYLAMTSGTLVEVPLDDIGSLDVGNRTVAGDNRTVLEVEHTEDETSVETYVSGASRHCSVLETVLRRGEDRTDAEIELTDEEEEVLMALYSGVSPFEIAEFVGMDPDEVEAIYDRLIELEVLREVRTRREVALEARGRRIASDVMQNQ